MPVIDNDKAIRGYWEEVKEKYPQLSFEKFEEICKAPFEYIKQSVRMDSLPIILIKYLGKLRPYRSTLLRMISAFKIKSKTEPRYIDKVEFLTKYVKHLNEYDKEDQEDSEG